MRILLRMVTGLVALVARLGDKVVKNPEVALGIATVMFGRPKK